MNQLDTWLNRATRNLSHESASRVRAEITEHYAAARETALAANPRPEEADRVALASLGDAKRTNCEYRKVRLTVDESRLLRQGNWEARTFCSRGWSKWISRGVSAALLLDAALVAYFMGPTRLTTLILAVSVGVALIFLAPRLPVYTPFRGRVFRAAKYLVMVGGGVFFLKSSWLIICCLWPIVWIEFTRASLRRKLPVAQWPKQLYL